MSVRLIFPGYLLVLLGVLSIATPVAAAPEFVDVTASRNIDFVGTYGGSFVGLGLIDEMMQRNMGNGAAVGDYDDDGDLDIYLLAQLGLPNVLLRNDLDLGTKSFTDVTAAAGLADLGLSRVAHFVDLDNNGRLDLLLVNDDDGFGSYPGSKIFRNDGDGSFTDVTAGSGFAPTGYLRCGAALADYDGDGLLDIYLTNWGREAGQGTPALPGSNRLYRNLGQFQFQDVTLAAGLGLLARDSFTAIFHDFEGDRLPELFVAVDHSSDEFYRNTAGTFSSATAAVGATHTGNDMGVALADFDDDGDLDLYATNITDPTLTFGTTQYNALHVNQFDSVGSTLFQDEAVARGAQDTHWGWGVEFTDVENDGDLDLVAVTGFDVLVPDASPINNTPSVLLLNDSTGQFAPWTGTGLDHPEDSRALIAFDYDRDGDEDLLVTNVNQPVRLLENQTDPAGHWLGIRLTQSPGANARGVGATVFATIGPRTLRRDLVVGESYLAGTPAEIQFGLGTESVVDELRVVWTDGSESLYFDVVTDRLVDVRQAIADADLDGTEDPGDCEPSDATVWSLPSRVRSLTLSGGPATALDWSAPEQPGSAAVTYDLLRSAERSFGGSVDCRVESGSELSGTDFDLPAEIFYYLVRVVNECGSHTGASSAGMPRMPSGCP